MAALRSLRAVNDGDAMTNQSRRPEQSSGKSSSRNGAEPFLAVSDLAARLEPLGVKRHESGGTVLFKQGEAARGAYVVLSGRVDVCLRATRWKRLLGYTAEPGAIVGLPATISDEGYSLTAITLEPCELVFISREDVLAILRTDPVLGTELLEVLAREVHRLRSVWPRRAQPGKRAIKGRRR